MNATQITLLHKTWRLLNRKWFVTPARLEKAIGKEPAAQIVKRIEDAYHISIEKTEQGFHMSETSAKQPATRKAKAAKVAASGKGGSRKKL
jgi:hypothetical protein